MSYRFFMTEPPVSNRYWLEGDQAHHLQSVMRKHVGDEVVLFDGTGIEFRASVVTLKKRRVELEILEQSEVSRELGAEIVIATALPKGNRQKFLIEKLVELGVACLIPLSTERSVADCGDGARERLERQVIEACKQCGRNLLMKIEPQVGMAELAEREFGNSATRILADPYVETGLGAVPQSQVTVVAIGPEGGFTHDEIEQLQQSGWMGVRFGPAILRMETAAIVAAVALGLGRS